MADNNCQHIIHGLQQKWQLQLFVSFTLLCLSFEILIAAVVQKFFPLSVLTVIGFILFIIIFLVIINKYWQVKTRDVINYLNKNFPSLEESAALLILQTADLNTLQQLQVKKIGLVLQAINIGNPFNRKIYKAILILFLSIITALIFINVDFSSNKITKQKGSLKNNKQEKILPQIASVLIKKIPPLYTNKLTVNQSYFNLKTEEGSTVNWQLNTTIPVKKLAFIFNDSTTVSLTQNNSNHTSWSLQKTISRDGFYQVKIDDKLSELYQIEVVKDLPPLITIKSPKPNTVIDYGQPTKVLLSLNIRDDYGVQEASISATIARGSGEGVKFKEQKINFTTSFLQHESNYQLQQIIDLKKLQMQPGDELYFYVKAIDNFKQETRSDIYIITLPDTTQLMSLEGLAKNINFKPEFFRSERQIIIDAEQLLKDKDTISVQSFNERCNNLGIDQKLLRLRYGKFLGEENESNLGIDGPEKLDAKEFGDATQMMDAVTDKHDNAEDATFLDADTKKKLKAVLNEMWSTELRLRTFKPQDALPFAYKALRLLKDLQQQSRAYVAKTSLRTIPLKPEKRLTADLTKISPPKLQQQTVLQTSEEAITREAISILEDVKYNIPIKLNDYSILTKATQQLSSKASAQPSMYLQGFQAMKRLIKSIGQKGVAIDIDDIKNIQKALQKTIQNPTTIPQQAKQAVDMDLSRQYFINLQKIQQ